MEPGGRLAKSKLDISLKMNSPSLSAEPSKPFARMLNLLALNIQWDVPKPKPATTLTPKKPVAYLESASIPITPADHIRKKIGNLEKKLDDIQKLQDKIQKGEMKNPEKTQLQKIERNWHYYGRKFLQFWLQISRYGGYW
uniref:Uncharacterized protein n=1 Tax=Ditylenchus dipsaci TaxID=166011 RepID=A0A915EMU6_9BILA